MLPCLQALEACMKNCGPEFHQKFAFNDTWAAIQMMAGKPVREGGGGGRGSRPGAAATRCTPCSAPNM